MTFIDLLELALLSLSVQDLSLYIMTVPVWYFHLWCWYECGKCCADVVCFFFFVVNKVKQLERTASPVMTVALRELRRAGRHPMWETARAPAASLALQQWGSCSNERDLMDL